MSSEQAKLIMDIINGLCETAPILGMKTLFTGIPVQYCLFCEQEQDIAYGQRHDIVHAEHCIITLNERLQATRQRAGEL